MFSYRGTGFLHYRGKVNFECYEKTAVRSVGATKKEVDRVGISVAPMFRLDLYKVHHQRYDLTDCTCGEVCMHP